MTDVQNPLPQPPPDRLVGGDPVPLELSGRSLNGERDKLAIVMVGLPGCGKTYVARRLARYLEFFLSLNVQAFTVADYRRKDCGAAVPTNFWDLTNNNDSRQVLEKCRDEAFDDLKAFLSGDSPESRKRKAAGEGNAEDEVLPSLGRVGFLDGLNITRAQRKRITEELSKIGVKTVFIESITTDPDLVELNFQDILKRMPDYRERPEAEVRKDWKGRIEYLNNVYEQVNAHGDEEHLSYIKVTNLTTFVINRVRTYIPGRIVQFLLNFHPRQRTIYLSRHGQSEYNELGKLGGDSNLTARGREYGKRLADFAEKNIYTDDGGKLRPARLWTSTLRRTRETASFMQHPVIDNNGHPYVIMRDKTWTNLDEIYAGICDGMTYEEVAAKYPDEATRRKQNKLTYRYPRGESYMDLIQRLEPIVHELERHEEPLLIIGHQAVLRIIYCYLCGLPRQEAPRVSMPLHTVIKLQPRAYECEEERSPLMLDEEGEPKDIPSH